MPSPFPGMDPYLESPAEWRGVHIDLVSKLRSTLNTNLPEGFVAEIDERLYIVNEDRSIYPDVAVIEEWTRPRKRQPRKANRGAVLESDPPFVIVHSPVQVREAFINIRRQDDARTILTTLEVLSPTNKNKRSPGFELYREKQREVLGSQISLVEIDLLRQGQHTVAASEEDLNAHGPWDYVVCVHRGGEGDRFETWPVTLRKRLPRFRVPVEPGVRDEVVDLQDVLQRCYDDSGYQRLLNYQEDPAPPLGPEDAAWADALLRENGHRPKRRRPSRNGGRS